MDNTIIDDRNGHGDPTEMFAYLSIDAHGESGICAHTTLVGITPMVGMTLDDMDKWRPFAKFIREQTGKKIQLTKFVATEVLD